MAEILLTATAAAGTAAGGAAIGSTALTILSGLATAVGVLGTLSSAKAEQNGYDMQAIQTGLEENQQQLQSRQRQTDMARELARVLGENDVAAAAAGIDLGPGGIAQAERTRAKQQATTQLTIERQDDDFQRAMLRARANGLRQRGRDAMTAGVVKSLGQFADFGVDVAKRG